MKSASNRIKIMVVFIVLALVGAGCLIGSIITNGSKWATSTRNTHLYTNGTLIGAGEITDADGKVLCKTKDGKRTFSTDSEVRKSLLHVVGDNYGFISSSIQNQYKSNLSGYNRVMGVWELSNFEQGSSVTLSVKSAICKKAYEALAGKKGAVCVYNYKTGAVVCSVSTPTYDPENVPDNINGNSDYEGVYINRVTMGLYPPGSTFKVITSAAAIDTVSGINKKTFYCDGAYHSGYGDVKCMGVHGSLSFKTALAKSCNSAFAEIANEVGGKTLTEYAEKFGYNKAISLDKLNTATAQFNAAKDDKLELGWAGIGQSTTLTTPLLQMRIMGTIANGGVPVEPYIVSKVTSASGFDNQTAHTTEGKRAVSEETASELKSMLRNNVENQYGDWHFNDGLKVCGKSGTAEVQNGKVAHAWFVGFCENEDCPYAFAAIVENGGWGSTVALPVAAAVINALDNAK